MMFKHLLPNARAWRLTSSKKLREFFEGLSGLENDITLFFDNVWLDIFPQTTRELDAWDNQFGLRDVGLTEQERRDRLDITWSALGGQDPRYIQDTLQANGFDVYVHEWWVPGSEAAPGVKAAATARNPLTYLRDSVDGIIYVVECGELLAECGEASAEAGNTAGATGYALVNKIDTSIINNPEAGELLMECGEVEAECNNPLGFSAIAQEYTVPADTTEWPYFLYIGGSTFGDLAQVDPKRKDEFEELCLKICPTQQWLGMLVEYI